MKKYLLGAVLAASSVWAAAGTAITVYQNPNCGCCSGWVKHMRDAGFDLKVIKAPDIYAVKQKFGVADKFMSCHTAVVDSSGQIIEGHVPAAAVKKLLANRAVKGIAAPGMPLNAPGMGDMDGNLVTVDFSGQPFSRD